MASEPLESVEQWKKKTFDFSNQSDDLFVPVISRSHEVVSLILKDANPYRIESELEVLDFTRLKSLRLEKFIEPSIRSMVYGAVESYHLALVHLMQRINKPSKIEWTQTEEVTTVDQVISEVVSKKGDIIKEEPCASIVEEWNKKTFDFSIQSDDLLVPVISRSHELVSLILKNVNSYRIESELEVLDFTRSKSLRLEKFIEPSIRSMMYGAMESYQLALVHLMQRINKPSKVEWTQTEEGSPDLVAENTAALDSALSDISTAPTFCHSFPLHKRELINPSENQSIPAKTQISPKDSVKAKMDIKKEDITKEEIMDDDSMPYVGFMESYAPLGEEVKKETEATEDRTITPVENGSINDQDYDVMDASTQHEVFDISDDSIKVDEIEKVGQKKIEKAVEPSEPIKKSPVTEKDTIDKGDRSSRRVLKPVNYAVSEGDDDDFVDEVSSMNDSRSESKETTGRKRKHSNEDGFESASMKKERKNFKRSETKMGCIECKFRSHSVNGFLTHLRYKHNTNPYLSGLVIRCECGEEGISRRHNSICDISNFEVIRNSTEPIRRLNDAKLTPQCIKCEKFPRTVSAYAQHLYEHHKTTLTANDIHLKCECGLTYTSARSALLHDKEKCDGRQYSLHKITDE